MDSLQDIMGSRRLTPPDEMGRVRDYIKRRYNSRCVIKLERDALIVSLPNSAMAGTLRLEQQNLIDACGLKKRLVIRIGQLN